MSGLLGSQVKDPNFRLRFFIIMFMGIIAFGVILYWRSQLLFSTEYVDFPMSKHLIEKNIEANE